MMTMTSRYWDSTQHNVFLHTADNEITQTKFYYPHRWEAHRKCSYEKTVQHERARS